MVRRKNIIEDFISDDSRKIDANGLAFCIYYNKPVSYGSSDKKIF